MVVFLFLVMADVERRRLEILVAVAGKANSQIAIAVNRIGKNGIELRVVADSDARPTVERDHIAGARHRATDRVMTCIILNMDSILAVAKRTRAILGGADVISQNQVFLGIAAQTDAEIVIARDHIPGRRARAADGVADRVDVDAVLAVGDARRCRCCRCRSGCLRSC